jgi:hypothetical protein
MLQIFEEIKQRGCDAISFFPNPDDNSDVIIQGLLYKEAGESIGGGSHGNSYDIVTFKKRGNDFTDKDHFEAVLVCPYTYSEKLLKDGYFGFVAKKTTTSKELVDYVMVNVDALVESETD